LGRITEVFFLKNDYLLLFAVDFVVPVFFFFFFSFTEAACSSFTFLSFRFIFFNFYLSFYLIGEREFNGWEQD